MPPMAGSGAALPRSSRYAWYVVGVLTLANLAGWVDRLILSLMVVPIRHDLGISDTQMSLLIGLAFSVFYTVLGLPIGWLADRASRRAIMGWGVAAWSVMTSLCGLAGSYGRLLLARVGVGVGEATLSPTVTSFLPDYFPPERLGSAMSVYSMGIFVGSGLAYVIGGAVVGWVESHGTIVLPVVGGIHPWQAAFFVVGAPGLVIALLFLTVREPPRGGAGIARRVVVDDTEGVQATPAEVRGASTRELFQYVRANLRSFGCVSLGYALSAMVNFGIAAWLATFLIRRYGWSGQEAGTVQGILTMTVGVLGVLGGGWVADRYVRRGKADGPLRVGVIGAVGMLVCASAYPFMPTAWLAVAWLVPVNFFAAFPWGAATAAAAEVVPVRMRAQGAAVYFFVQNLVSSAIGPTFVAVMTDYVFRADAAVGYSLVVVNVVGMAAAIAVLVYGMPAYRKTIADLRG